MKSKYNMSASEISLSLEALVDTIRNIISCENIMIISPPYIRSGTPTTDKHYIGANYKSVEVDKYYKQLAQTKKLIFVSGLQAQTGIDGEHLSIQGHQYLARRVKSKVDELISTDQPNQ